MKTHTQLLIIGAGPFGLAMAAYAKRNDIDHLVLGKTMDFWKSNMPKGMLLRSACDWHLDPFDTHTIEQYLKEMERKPEDVEPLSLEFYLDYSAWFVKKARLEVVPRFVRRLDCLDAGDHRFEASLDDGETITANHVVLALGFQHFKHVPEELNRLFPPDSCGHTCDKVDFEPLRGKRCLIVGGRQSAFEWAALLREAGSAAVHVCHRHATPAFEESDWSWVNPLIDAMVENPGWYRNLPPAEKDALNHRFWAEGRLKLEPWLRPRVEHDSIRLWPDTQVVACDRLPSGELKVRLDKGDVLTVDQVIFATGYKVDVGRIPMLAHGNLLARLTMNNGYPVLDEHFQASIPGLFFTSMPATQDFGSFFAFTVSVRTSAKLIGPAIRGKG